MTKEFENLKQIVSVNVAEQELKIRTQKEEERTRVTLENIESQKRAEENMRILKESGVVGLFEEIKESGLLKLRDYPQYEMIPVYKKNFWGKDTYQGKEKKLISEYSPAEIKFGSKNEDIEIHFNYSETGGEYSRSETESIRIVVTTDKRAALETTSNRMTHSGRSSSYEKDYTPIDKSNIAEIIGPIVARYSRK